jgi:hypothetical protein
MPAADRTYAAQVIAARTGLSQADAEKRVSDVVEQARSLSGYVLLVGRLIRQHAQSWRNWSNGSMSRAWPRLPNN